MFRRDREVNLDSPVLVMALDGWVDASLAGGNVMAALIGSANSEPVATFDTDLLLDLRSRRPTQHIVDGVLTEVSWPEVQLRAGRDAAGRDLLLLVGPEPDYNWRSFSASVAELVSSLGTRLAVGVGGFPAPVPHTRPVRVVTTATDAEMAKRVGFIPGERVVPAGIHAVLLKELKSAGVPALSLWAMVPHYLSGMPYPACSVALMERLSELSGLTIDTNELRAAAEVTRQRVDELISEKEEHVLMVRTYESQFDANAEGMAAGGSGPELRLEDLPSGDELAAELERFLREHPPQQ